DEHCCFYLHPLLKPFFCHNFKNYEVRLNKSVDNSLKRPDFTKHSINQLLSKKGGPNYTMFLSNMALVESILAPISTSLYYTCSQIAIGLDYTLESNGDSEFDKKAYRIFNILKDELPLVPKPKMTEVRLNKSVNNSLKRPDFSCRIDNITILNSEIKPSGYTPFQKNKDFVKINTRAKHSINQLLSKKGGPNYTMFLSNMALVGDKIDSFFMTLNHNGIYQAWPWLNTKLVMDRSSFPLM
ncbi:7507_t:CDS:2, partial [Entrophospora sp. SA101]